MIRTVIVDDERLARDRLATLLRDFKDIDVVAQAGDGVSAVEVIETQKPDLVFLDVQMPGLDGFGVLKSTRHPPVVVFATAYDEYALKAFEVHAADYLLKPVSRARLEQTLHRIRARLSGQAPLQELTALLERIEQRDRRYLEQLPVQRSRQIMILPVAEIFWFEVDLRIVYANVDGDRFMIDFTLKDLVQRLDPDVFFRCHKSRLVNLKHVKAIVPWSGGRFKLVMRDQKGSEVELSRAQARELRERMHW